MSRTTMRHGYLHGLWVCALALVACSARADERPNFILLMGDDHGWDEVAYNGHPHLKTPVLDAMAAQGLRFDRFYSAHPSCSPTRGSIRTGRHPNRYGTFAPTIGRFAPMKSVLPGFCTTPGTPVATSAPGI